MRLASLVIATTAVWAWLGTALAADKIATLSETLRKDRDEKARIAAAIALGRLADRRGVDALMQALGDRSKLVRGVAASALGHIGDERAIRSLEKALSDSSSSVRRRARSALQTLRKKNARPAADSAALVASRTPPRGYAGVSVGPRFHVVVKATGAPAEDAGKTKSAKTSKGKATKKQPPPLARLLPTLLRKELDENPDITTDDELGRELKQYVVDGAIRRVWNEARGPYMETSCEVKLTVSSPDGRILSIVTGAATVQTGRAYYRTSMSAELEAQALENAVKGAHQNLATFLNR